MNQSQTVNVKADISAWRPKFCSESIFKDLPLIHLNFSGPICQCDITAGPPYLSVGSSTRNIFTVPTVKALSYSVLGKPLV